PGDAVWISFGTSTGELLPQPPSKLAPATPATSVVIVPARHRRRWEGLWRRR
ncbi:MAG: hypothetical protein JWN96_2462, partial [Mycobacterium sp.]|nr:hypothetical protein [Mycobacterium sp.]